jgi:hypothetical protein
MSAAWSTSIMWPAPVTISGCAFGERQNSLRLVTSGSTRRGT